MIKAADFKYLWANIIPITLIISLYFKGYFSFAGLIVAFLLIPLLELFLPGTEENLEASEESHLKQKKIFDWLLYSNVPIVISISCWYFFIVYQNDLSQFEYFGLTISMGIFLGAMGINVAHELGHRSTWQEKLMAKILLIPNLYTHFTIEHNRGHHVNIATKADPASSRYNEWLYIFWFRSIIMTYVSAWKLEHRRLKAEKKAFFSIHNEMILNQLLQLIYLMSIWWIGGWALLISAIFIAIGGFLMLETVNYIEHYGLERRKLPSGRYERVKPYHSWNSNHVVGRIILYELTRHSDHHFKASRKYQILRHFDESPQLPYGYPCSMLLALFPPLWFAIMNPRVRAIRAKTADYPMN